jgi:hypothetical protein
MVRNVATVFAAAAVAATLNAVTAQADTLNDFTTPSGNIYCEFSTNGDDVPIVACEGDGNYVGPRPPCASFAAFGDRFYMAQGELPESHCHTDTIRSNQPFAPVLEYGQTKSNGTITCDSETTGLTCTDASTGDFFTMSREANTLG